LDARLEGSGHQKMKNHKKMGRANKKKMGDFREEMQSH
jgi:hypothetical protein